MKRKLHVLGVLALAAVLAAGAAQAGGKKKSDHLYKWTDENGNVHYGDQIPPQYAKQQRQVLTEQGVTVKTLDAQKTQEQLAAEQAAAEQAAQEKQEQEARSQHDHMLLSTYASVDDLQQARDRRIAALDSQIKVTRQTVGNLESEVTDLEGRTSDFTKNNKPVPDSIANRLAAARKELMENQRFILEREQEQQQIRATFDADIARYKELTATAGD